MSPVSTPCDDKHISAEAIKPNWRVASDASQTLTYHHPRHAQRNTWRKSAGQGCPAPVERSTKPVHAEAMKPNWRVASRMPRRFANQHIRHARRSAGRRSAGQGCPAPAGKKKHSFRVMHQDVFHHGVDNTLRISWE